MENKENKENKYICTKCGNEIKLGKDSTGEVTDWSNVPDDWACPTCGGKKDLYLPYYVFMENTKIT